MSELYHRILLAMELEEASDEAIIQQSKKLAKHENVEFSLVHAIEHLANFGSAYTVTAGIDIEEVLIEESVALLAEIGAKLNVPEERQYVLIGPAKSMIINKANEINADLIVVGSHGRHGVRLLLGSTANAVLHEATCDVLAVRVSD